MFTQPDLGLSLSLILNLCTWKMRVWGQILRDIQHPSTFQPLAGLALWLKGGIKCHPDPLAEPSVRIMQAERLQLVASGIISDLH